MVGGAFLWLLPSLAGDRARQIDADRFRFPVRLSVRAVCYGLAGVGFSGWLRGENGAFHGLALAVAFSLIPLWCGEIEFSRSKGIARRRLLGLWRTSIDVADILHTVSYTEINPSYYGSFSDRQLVVVAEASDREVVHHDLWHADQERLRTELRRLRRLRMAES